MTNDQETSKTNTNLSNIKHDKHNKKMHQSNKNNKGYKPKHSNYTSTFSTSKSYNNQHTFNQFNTYEKYKERELTNQDSTQFYNTQYEDINENSNMKYEKGERFDILSSSSSNEVYYGYSNISHHKKKFNNNTHEYNNRILAAKREGNIRAVMNEFISMKKKNVPQTQHTYNLVLEAHSILRKEGTPLTNMLKVYNEMLQVNIQPNAYTYLLLIRALCKRDVEVQKTIAMLKRQSARIGNEIEDVRLLESERNIDMAMSIFYNAISDGVSVNTFEIDIFNQLLRVLSHYGNTNDATFIYHRLEDPQVQAKANSATFAALINLHGRAGDIDMALHYYDVYRQAKNSLGPHDTSYIFNALVDCHLKCNQLEGALHVVEHDMIENNIKLTCIPYNSIIRYYCSHSQMDEAEMLVGRLSAKHKKDKSKYPCPDASSYGPILAAYCQSDNWSKATHIYNELRKTDMTKAYGNLANYALLCLTHQDRFKALGVIEDMTSAHLEPDPVLAKRIIISFTEANETSQAIIALETIQTAMTPRTLSKGCQHILASALEVVQCCTSIIQILQVIQLISSLVKSNFDLQSQSSDEMGYSFYVNMCKSLINFYSDQKQDFSHSFTINDYQLIFDAVFALYGHETSAFLAPGDIFIQLLNDMRKYRITLPDSLYHDVLRRLRQHGDIETEYRWKVSFHSTAFQSKRYASSNEDDIIIEIADLDSDDIYQNPAEQKDLDITWSNYDLISDTQIISNDILKAIMNENNREAIRIFEDKIICQGLIPTTEVMGEVIRVAGKQGDLQTALIMYNNAIYAFKDIQDAKEKDDAIYIVTNSLLIGYAQQGNMEMAKLYYDRIKAMGRHPDSDGYISMLLGSAKCATDEAIDALLIYQEAKLYHVKPTTFFYNVVISKLAKSCQLDTALTLFKEMKEFKIPANSITYGAIISACVRSGSESHSKELFHEMLLSPTYQPRVGPFNNMMQFYVRKRPDRASVLEYFTKMRQHGIKPSPYTYKLLMEAHAHIPPYDMPMAHKLLYDMTRYDHLRPQPTHYTTLITSYGLLQRDVQSAERVFIEMKKSNVQPDEATLQSMIDVFVNNDQIEKAEKLYQEEILVAKNIKRNGLPFIEDLLIRGYGEKGQIEKAKEIFNSMSNEYRPHTVLREPSSYEAMIRACLENNKVDEAKVILGKMIKRDFPPKVVSAIANLVTE